MRAPLVFAPLVFAALLFAAPGLAAPPFTPGSAGNPYPRLCLLPADVPRVRARLGRDPYATLYARVLARARSTPSAQPGQDGDRARSFVAKAAAFASALGAEADSEALGTKAEALLANLEPETGITGFSNANNALAGAERLHGWAMAYDLLEGSGRPLTRRAEIRERLARLAGNLYDDFTNRNYYTFRSYNQNHTTKVASAVGMAAIALDGYEPPPDDPRAAWQRPADWIDWALDRVDLLIADALTTEEGGYTEGPVYYHYTAVQHVPFLRAWHLYGGTYGGIPRTLRGGRSVGDLWTSASVRGQQSWLLALRMPDGTLPPFNDATPGVRYFYGLFSDHPEAAAMHWAWTTGPGRLADGGLAEEILCAHDDAVAAAPPPGPPSRFLSEAGQAALRTGWGEDDVYLLLQAEHGKTYGLAVSRDGEEIDGTAGHNHADPLSYVLYAFGEYLALDGGYLGWENHDKVKGPAHHNLILVDGVGPREPYLTVPPVGIVDGGVVILDPSKEGGWVAGGDGEAFLEGGADFGSLRHAHARTRYEELVSEPIDLGRRVALLGGRAVALLDDASGSVEHAYTWLLHGNAGGTSGGAFEARPGMGGVWRRPRAAMAAAFAAADATPEITEALDVHDAGGWVERRHVVLRFTVRGSGAKAATLIALTRAGEEDPRFEQTASGAGWRARFADGSWALAARGPTLTWTGGSARADALALWRGAAGEPGALQAVGATVVTKDGVNLLEASAPASVALGQDGDTVRADVDAPGGVTLAVPASVAETRGVCRIEEGCVVVPPGKRRIAIALGGPRRNSAPVAIARAARGTLDGSGSCDPDGDALTYRWEIRGTAVGVTLAGADQPRATLTGPPGVYPVVLTVSDGTRSDSAAVTVTLEGTPAQGGCGCGAAGTPATVPLSWLALVAVGCAARALRGTFMNKVAHKTRTPWRADPHRSRCGASAVCVGRTRSSRREAL